MLENLKYDVLVIGSGAAGPETANEANGGGLGVAAMSKVSSKKNCTILSGGMVIGTSNGESPEGHLWQTLQCARVNRQLQLTPEGE